MRTAGDIEETEFSPAAFFSLLDTPRLCFSFIKAINQSKGEVLFDVGGARMQRVIALSFNITSNAGMHIAQSHLQKHTAVLVRFTFVTMHTKKNLALRSKNSPRIATNPSQSFLNNFPVGLSVVCMF